MTQNQIRYLEALENARANQARELENQRSNLAKESETKRSNLENERMAREKWDYEKYGKGGSGITGEIAGGIRTIKGVINDAVKIGGKLSNELDKASGKNVPTINELVGSEKTNWQVGNFPSAYALEQMQKESANDVSKMSREQVLARMEQIKRTVRGSKSQIDTLLKPLKDRLEALKDQEYLKEYERREE